LQFDAPGTRRDEKDLLALADAPEPGRGGGGGGRGRFQATPEQRAAFAFSAKKLRFLHDEGAAVLVDPSRAGDGGTIFVQSASVPLPPTVDPLDPNAPRQLPVYDKNAPKIAPQLVLSVEHYNRIVRMIQAGEKVKMTVELGVEWQDADPMGYNTIAEIPGSDLKDEIVMLGGHMDSWHAGTGATDNGAGVSVAMEAVRILQALNLKPRRTIRIGLWTGEEQGLLGSRAYVAEHFGKIDPPVAAPGAPAPAPGARPAPGNLVTKPEYEKFSSYFNLDNGTGKIRGVYLQGNESVRGLFRQWLMPFRDMGAIYRLLGITRPTLICRPSPCCEGIGHLQVIHAAPPAVGDFRPKVQWSGRRTVWSPSWLGAGAFHCSPAPCQSDCFGATLPRLCRTDCDFFQ
jgi:hypothetical protein